MNESGWNSSYMGCRSVTCYRRLNKIDAGSYGTVFRAQCKDTGVVYALKKIKNDGKSASGFPITSLREINILLAIKHVNIIGLKEIVVDNRRELDKPDIFMVMEYMPHDLKILLATIQQPFRTSEVKCLMKQLLSGVNEMHHRWVIHRDLKCSNILLSNDGILKICDFGLARRYGSPVGSYTELVVTLWYRAPELLLGTTSYTTAIDMWSVGCIMYELLTCKPLFAGKGELEQLKCIFKLLGTPDETVWPGCTQLKVLRDWKPRKTNGKPERLRELIPTFSYTQGPVLSTRGYELLTGLLTYDPTKRLTASEALNHEWFNEAPVAQHHTMMPTFPSLNEDVQKRQRALNKSPDPLNALYQQDDKHHEITGFYL